MPAMLAAAHGIMHMARQAPLTGGTPGVLSRMSVQSGPSCCSACRDGWRAGAQGPWQALQPQLPGAPGAGITGGCTYRAQRRCAASMPGGTHACTLCGGH